MPILHPSLSITLAPIDISLAPILFAIVDKNRAYLRQWLSWLDTNNSVEDSRKYIEQISKDNDEGNKLILGIFYNKELIGTISIYKIDWTNKEAAIGYWLDKDHQEKGIVTLSCKALMDYVFNELQLNKVIIRCATGNEKSRAIPRRLGFREVEIIKNARWLYDHYIDIIVYEKTKE